jgi:hypothetical protein
MAAKERKEAKAALDRHHAQGNHKRWALAYPAEPVPAICKQAAEVQKKNNPGKAGQEKAKKFTGDSSKGSGSKSGNNNKHH